MESCNKLFESEGLSTRRLSNDIIIAEGSSLLECYNYSAGKQIVTFRKIIVFPVFESGSSKLINTEYAGPTNPQKVAVPIDTAQYPEDLNIQQHDCENLQNS